MVGVICGIYDKVTATRPDLPIHHIPINLAVTSLGVAGIFTSYVFLDKLDKFKKIWNDYGELLVNNVLDKKRFIVDPFGDLKISMSRFNLAFERKEPEDQFIDNIIALEALFSKDKDPYQGVTTRLSRRIELFL